ncbi:toll-like receptor 2 [Lingula anatina]|uniref:Toll-like receptor 2 n=1 Tax=Lingula anatina TaxID=7574 RepID=A0A1S3HB11_LINAN|nr:toll-like receptor 2 [Lingula anatina]|eukprot:XP_013382646.1 toll-like receptor 2 [Lingula anatina]
MVFGPRRRLLLLAALFLANVRVVFAGSLCPCKCTCTDDIRGLGVNCANMAEDDLPELPLHATSLRISGRFETLRNGTFSGFFSLKDLNMSECNLKTIEHGALLGIYELRNVSFQNNLLVDLPRFITLLPNLERANFQGNRIKVNASTFPASPNTPMSSTLMELDISSNEISDMGVLYNILLSFTNLRKLVARNNGFTNMSQRDFPFHKHLQVLDLTYNWLPNLYLNFAMLTSLKELYMWETGCTFFIQNMSSLATFQYKRNAFCVPDSDDGRSLFVGLSGLEELDLEGNNLFCDEIWSGKTLPSIFKSLLPNLKILVLASNHVTKLPMNMFYKVPSLEYLDLSNNDLKSIDSAINTLDSLVYLNLRDNRLFTLEVDILQKNTDLRYLNVEANQFFCSCETSRFSAWIRNHTTRWPELRGENQTCSGPIEFRNTRLRDFAPNWITCNMTPFVFVCIGAGVLVVTTLASIMAYHRLDIVYWWHLRRLSGSRRSYIRCHENQAQYEYDAFVAYAGSSEEWIVRQFLPHVEGQGRSTDRGQGKGQDISFKVCIHSRDFLPGEYIIDNIVEKMEASRATILIISHNFLKSDWCKYEVDITQAKVLRERRGALIVVFLEQIPYKQLPKTLRLMKRHVTYLEWPAEENEQKRAEFWKKMKLSLLKRIQQTHNISYPSYPETQV